jgi:hypothetical protein
MKVSFLGFDVKSCTCTIFDDGNTPFSATTLSSVGKAVAGILKHPGETSNKSLYCESLNVTQNQCLATFQKATGKDWIVNRVTTADAVKENIEKLAKRDVMGLYQLLVCSIYGPNYGCNYRAIPGFSSELLGVPQEDLRTVVREIVNAK